MKKSFTKFSFPFLFLLIFSFETTAQQQCWTSVGSAGTVDEADLNIVAISSNTTAVNPATVAGTVDVRFNIVATAGLFGGECNVKTLTARYADNGSSAQVLIRLYTFNIQSGVSSTLVELNSNNFPQSNVAQARSVTYNGNFNFSTNIYYIEVQLHKTNTSGNPLIRALQICGAGICLDASGTDLNPDNLGPESGYLEQNTPNPFNRATDIQYNLPEKFSKAQVIITDKYGQTLKQMNISGSRKGSLKIDASTFSAGVYNYALIVDGIVISSKQMVLTK